MQSIGLVVALAIHAVRLAIAAIQRHGTVFIAPE
jgi:hypothetical protein